METNIDKRPYSATERTILLAVRVITVTLLTALIVGIENAVYTVLFEPTLPAGGPLIALVLLAAYLSLPFIFAGLLLFGLPSAYLLSRLQAESARNYALAGALTGVLWGVALKTTGAPGLGSCAFYGFTCALFWWWLRPRA